MTRADAKEITLKIFGRFVGAVSWCVTPPHGIGFQTHKFTILDAIELAKNLLVASGGTGKVENLQMVVGKEWASILVTLPCFEGTVTHWHIGGLSITWDTFMGKREACLSEGSLAVKMAIVDARPFVMEGGMPV